MGDPTPRDAEMVVADLPLGGLPPADTTPLEASPLEVAIVEVRFTSSVDDVPASFASALRDALAGALGVALPTIQRATQNNMQIDFNAGPSWSGEQVLGWHLASADGQHNATIFPSSIVWQVGDYSRWRESVRRPLAVLLDAIEVAFSPDLTQRIGLRYVDRFIDPSCKYPSDWLGKMTESLLGPLQNPFFGTLIRGAQQQVELALDDQHGAVLRHGPIKDQNSEETNYLLDLDVYANAADPYDSDHVLRIADRLNSTALSLFQACITPEYLASLRGDEGQ